MRSGHWVLFFLAVVVLVFTGTPSAVAYGVPSPVPAIPSSPILHVEAESAYPVEPIKFALETRIGLFASGDPVNHIDADGRVATKVTQFAAGYATQQAINGVNFTAGTLSFAKGLMLNPSGYESSSSNQSLYRMGSLTSSDFNPVRSIVNSDLSPNYRGMGATVSGLAVSGLISRTFGASVERPQTFTSIRIGGSAAEKIGAGTKVFRVWGDEAGSMSRSWTTVDPRTVANFRDVAGLPTQNSGRFISEGILKNTQGVTTRGALPLHGNTGGLSEVIVPNPASQIRLQNVQGLNPEF